MKLANYFDYNTGIDIILWRGEKRWGEVLETVALQWRGLTVSLNIAIVSEIVNEGGSGYVADLRLLTCEVMKHLEVLNVRLARFIGLIMKYHKYLTQLNPWKPQLQFYKKKMTP